MATKIDLLPEYVKLTKRLRLTVGLAIVGLSLWTGGLLLTYHSKQLELQTAEQDRNVVQALASQTDAAQQAKVTADGTSAGYKAANSFMLLSCKSGSERAALINLLSKYIYRDSVVKSIDISNGQTVNITATVATPDDYYQFIDYMRRGTGVVFQADPKFSGVGGFANGATPLVLPRPEAGSAPVVINYPITVSAQGALLNPITVPPDPTGGAVAAAPGTDQGIR